MKFTYKKALLVLSVVSMFMMTIMDYDADYKITILMPLVYCFLTGVYFKEDKLNYGPCSKALMGFYGFRMCVLPVLCAYGNFWLEADKSLIMTKYNLGILYICIEFLVVILSLLYYNRKFNDSRLFLSNSNRVNVPRHSLFTKAVLALSLLFIFLFIFIGPDYFHFITSEMDEVLREEEPVGHSGFWYLEDFVCILARPLLSFLIVCYCLKKKNPKGYFIIFFVILFNFLFVSDRRIFSLLISGTCIYYIISTTRNKKFRITLNVIMTIGAIFMIYACLFFQINAGEEMLSRTVQHYFSGPSLNALALIANEKYSYTITHFLKLMWNCSFILCAFFSSFPGTKEYEMIFGFVAWTPMFMDCVRYFGVLAPLFLIIFVKFIVNCDRRIKNTNETLYKMTYMFLGITTSCYMIMYNLHLVLYFLLSSNLIYRYLMGDLFKTSKKKRIVYIRVVLRRIWI